MTAPVVVLDRSGVIHLRRGHPWLFPDHVAEVSAADGELVRLEGPAGTGRGAAVYAAGSRLPLRVVSRDPAFDTLDAAWWAVRLDRSIARRGNHHAPGHAGRDHAEAPLVVPFDSAPTGSEPTGSGLAYSGPTGNGPADTACRWVHAEADGLPGLVVDRYGDVAVLQAGCRWADQVASLVAARLVERHGITGVLARHDGGFRRPEGLAEGVQLLAGEVPELVDVTLGGLRRSVDPWRGQKTGTYLDQRENQSWAAEVLPVGRCLDAFCNEGGFALQLAAAGCDVLALDGSEPALERLRANAEANGLLSRVEARRANVFDALRDEAEGGFDGVVLDPPALAKKRGDLTRAIRAYRDLNLRALRLLRPGGRLLTCSCSHHLDREAFRGVLTQAAAASGREVLLIDERAAARCHPRLLGFPESDYLKVMLLEVRA